jgi:signal transduction histidine kinase
LVVPAVAIIAALSWQAYRNEQRAVRAEVANTARAVAGVIDIEIERSLSVLHAISATRAIQLGDWAAVDDIAREILPDHTRWLVVVDMQGRQRINTLLPRGAKIPDIKLDPAYIAAMRAGRNYVSDLVYGPAANQTVIHFGHPFVATDGELYGLDIVMLPAALSTALDVRRFAPDGVLTILDRTGKIIARFPNQERFAGRPATADMVKATHERAEGIGDSVTLEGIPVLMAFTHAKDGWSVLIGTRTAKVFANIEGLFAFGLGAALLVTLAAFGLALRLAGAVVRGVDGLADDAERLARGEEPASPASGLLEIHTVAAAMRRMAATKTDAERQLREARDRLHDYAQELERKVEERTASWREAAAQMEEFSYTVSHDLRGPLRAMSGFAAVLLDDHAASLDAQGREYLQRIGRASERMDRLTSDLLRYSRVAREDLQRERVALEPLVRGLIWNYEELNPKRTDVALVCPMADVLAHETSLTQAMANLVTNAAKFVKPGERPQITVRTERRDGRVRVWVEDKGVGINPKHQERLFRIFERAHANQGYDGTGVGLAIVRKVVERSGGTCGVESDGVSGSRFWIELDAAT